MYDLVIKQKFLNKLRPDISEQFTKVLSKILLEFI